MRSDDSQDDGRRSVARLETTSRCAVLLASCLLSVAACQMEPAELHPDPWEGPSLQAAPPPAAPIAESWCDQLPRAAYATLVRVPIEADSEWFEVYEVGVGVYAIYEPFQWQEVISYLILGQDRALLFDSGLGVAPIRPVVEQLTTLPVTVLNSHTHYDHIGGNYEFDRVLARKTDYTERRTAGQISEALRDELSPQALCAPLPDGVTREGFRSNPWTVSTWLGEQDTVDLGNRLLRIIAIPGHAPDAIVLVEEESGYVWSGDSFYEGPIWLFDIGTDLAAYRESAQMLATLADTATRIFPAHNTPVADPMRLVELRDAFEDVWAGRPADDLRPDGIAVHEFGPFSLLVNPRELPEQVTEETRSP